MNENIYQLESLRQNVNMKLSMLACPRSFILRYMHLDIDIVSNQPHVPGSSAIAQMKPNPKSSCKCISFSAQ